MKKDLLNYFVRYFPDPVPNTVWDAGHSPDCSSQWHCVRVNNARAIRIRFL